MPTPTIENILAIFDEEYSISLKKMTGKKDNYEGKQNTENLLSLLCHLESI
ncbi:MAG: hypothetical protein ACNYPI_05110 [Arenicellales bacterium WSBS_2016_MAG_OTU3]